MSDDGNMEIVHYCPLCGDVKREPFWKAQGAWVFPRRCIYLPCKNALMATRVQLREDV